ncbi:TPA: DUF2920 family protein [Campylobacter jejuni]|nr:DUF2920 family protein [Campylobacter jejuni]EKG4139223.1 DUF2920 family protein [Campylobacter jejuni]EKK0826503.1 DUF2920 family protein [Campylobacter jejuni]EMD0545748.1 DUF2920 family protein [Campylobacter jejuni]HEC1694893.1 DUF2920 family protein [Campylobacter jejuni]
MLINQTFEIDSCDDVELGIKRTSKLEYRISYDDEKDIKAIVFIIPGFGGDADGNYRKHLVEYVAKEFQTMVISVNYHCIKNRLQFGASLFMDNIDKFILQENCTAFNIAIPIHLNKITDILSYLDDNMEKLKNEEKIKENAKMSLSITLEPGKNEYQNFGVMQAQDLINALLHLKKEKYNLLENIPVIMIGSSHGGYLAHLAAKIAPWLVDGVIDNSSYAKTPLQYLGFGKEIDYMRHYEACDISNSFKNLNLLFYSKTFWTSNKFLKNYFSKDKSLVRDILNYKHLNIMSNYDICFISYHSIQDDYIAPIGDKILLYDYLNKLNIDAELNIIRHKEQIDGRFIKNLEHGMGMSIKFLINNNLPKLFAKIQLKKRVVRQKTVSYPCQDLIYTFYEENNKINLKIEENICS